MEIKSDRKERSPQRVIFVNNCIVIKVQEFMYKKIQLCWPQHPEEKHRENRRKAPTLGRRVRTTATYRTQ